MKLTISANTVEEAIGQIVEWMRRGAETEESCAKTASLLREKRDYLARAAALRIYASMLSKIEVVSIPVITNRQAHEEAAGMGLCDEFFTLNHIDPDAPYHPRAKETQ